MNAFCVWILWYNGILPVTEHISKLNKWTFKIRICICASCPYTVYCRLPQSAKWSNSESITYKNDVAILPQTQLYFEFWKILRRNFVCSLTRFSLRLQYWNCTILYRTNYLKPEQIAIIFGEFASNLPFCWINNSAKHIITFKIFSSSFCNHSIIALGFR